MATTSSDSSLPIGITMGDPAGIGPEVICKALAQTSPAERKDILVIGSRPVLERADALCGTDVLFTNFQSNDQDVCLLDMPTTDVEVAPATERMDAPHVSLGP